MKAREDLDIDAVRAALSGRVIGGRLLHHDVLSSTMDEARLLASEGWSEGLVVVADPSPQTSARSPRPAVKHAVGMPHPPTAKYTIGNLGDRPLLVHFGL